MKKILFAAALFLAMQTCVNAQYGSIWNQGNRLTYNVPPIQASQSITALSYSYLNPTAAASIPVTVSTLLTDVHVDTVVGNSAIVLNPYAGVSGTLSYPLGAGAQVCIYAGGASDSSRKVFVYQGSTVIDTLTVTNHTPGAIQTYWYTGTVFHPVKK